MLNKVGFSGHRWQVGTVLEIDGHNGQDGHCDQHLTTANIAQSCACHGNCKNMQVGSQKLGKLARNWGNWPETGETGETGDARNCFP